MCLHRVVWSIYRDCISSSAFWLYPAYSCLTDILEYRCACTRFRIATHTTRLNLLEQQPTKPQQRRNTQHTKCNSRLQVNQFALLLWIWFDFCISAFLHLHIRAFVHLALGQALAVVLAFRDAQICATPCLCVRSHNLNVNLDLSCAHFQSDLSARTIVSDVVCPCSCGIAIVRSPGTVVGALPPWSIHPQHKRKLVEAVTKHTAHTSDAHNRREQQQFWRQCPMLNIREAVFEKRISFFCLDLFAWQRKAKWQPTPMGQSTILCIPSRLPPESLAEWWYYQLRAWLMPDAEYEIMYSSTRLE